MKTPMTGRLAAALGLVLLAASAHALPGESADPPAERASVAAAAPTTRAGDLTIETPWMRATPAGAKVAGGYVRITNTGTAPDRLMAVAIPLAGRGEIHSVTMEEGVMKMAPIVGGLTIAPGTTVELKPGGFHMMFEDLRSAPKAGESVAGTLTFERAGAVPVTFAVAPIGAMAPDGAALAPAATHQHH